MGINAEHLKNIGNFKIVYAPILIAPYAVISKENKMIGCYTTEQAATDYAKSFDTNKHPDNPS